MAVRLEHQGAVLVSQPLGHRHDRLARSEQHRGEVVAQMVAGVPAGSPALRTPCAKIRDPLV
jgi:hypothetical protein